MEEQNNLAEQALPPVVNNIPTIPGQTLVAPVPDAQTVAAPMPTGPLPSQQIPINTPTPVKEHTPFILFDPSFLLRVGLAFVFIYAAINFFLNPDSAAKYIPAFVNSIIPNEIFLHVFEIYEILLAVWLLTGKFSQYAGILAALTLVGITGLNLESFNVVFRNVAIIFAAIALSTLHFNKKN